MQKIELTPVSGGRSGAQIFRFQLDDTDYCLKIPKHQTTSADFQCFHTICQLYQQANIRSLKFLGYGHYLHQSFYLYRYISGENLKILSDTSYTTHETCRAGVQAGHTLRRLHDVSPLKINSIPSEDLKKLIYYGQQLHNQLVQNSVISQLLTKHQLLTLLTSLMAIFANAETFFANLSPRLIHGDIKRSNIIIDQNECQHFIDIGAMKISYDVLNFRYQIIWDLLPENRQRRAFTKGFFDGVFRQQYPNYFHQQIIFTSILNFLEHTAKFSHDLTELDWYFGRTAPLFRALLAGQNPLIEKTTAVSE